VESMAGLSKTSNQRGIGNQKSSTDGLHKGRNLCAG
jgi:hypothetical protein